MGEEKTEHIESMEGNKDLQQVPQEPVVNAQGVKVYPTSFISVKGQMEPSRIPTAKMSGLQIEIWHVVIFLGLTVFLFIGMWKRPNQR